MIDSIFVALSGMRGHERGLSVLSNNVANINTPGFRGSSVRFTDVLSELPQRGVQDGPAGDAPGLGGGLDASRTLLDMQLGEPQQTGRDLDLRLDGPGFFVLRDEAGAQRYTRNGRFDFDGQGRLVLFDQPKLQVMARSDSGDLAPLSLDGLTLNPSRTTTTVKFRDTLSAGDADSDHLVDPVQVYDQQGGLHTLKLRFQKQGASTPESPTTPGAPGNVVWKVTAFEGELSVGSVDLTVQPGGVVLQQPEVQLTLKNTAAITVKLDFAAAQLSDTGTSSALKIESQDGRGQGTIATRAFGADGTLKLTYTNGETVAGPQLALAQIDDERGLAALGDALFEYRGDTGVALREAGDDLRVVGGSLELSNVDLTTEFSELILMQRGYQASSQIVSTANDMLQELLEMRGRR